MWWKTLLFALGLLAVLSAPGRIDEALWLRSGQHIWEHGLPASDVFTVVGANAPWVNSSWLFDVAFAGVYRLGGDWGVAMCGFLVLAAALAMLLELSGKPHSPAAALFFAAALLATRGRLTLSGELMDLLLASALLLTLRRFDRHGNGGMLIVPVILQVFWCNTSAHFLLGPPLLLAWGVGRWAQRIRSERRQRWWLVAAFLAMCGACLVSPFGLANVTTGLGLLVPLVGWSRETLNMLDLYRPFWDVSRISVELVAAAGLMCAALVFSLRTRGPAALDVPTLVVVQALAWLFERHAALAGFLSAAALTEYFSGAPCVTAKSERSEYRFAAAAAFTRRFHVADWMAGLICLVLAAAWLARAGGIAPDWAWAGLESPRCDYALFKSGPLRGTVLTLPPSDAALVLWSWPRARPVVDGRLEVHGDHLPDFEQFGRDLLDNRRAPYRRARGGEGGWAAMAREHGIGMVVVRADDLAAISRLANNESWAALDWDDSHVVFGLPEQHQAALATARQKLRDLEDGPWQDAAAPHGPPQSAGGWRKLTTARQRAITLRRARLLLALGRPVPAIRQARTALYLDPAHAAAYDVLGQANAMLAAEEQLTAGQPSRLRQVAGVSLFNCALRLDPALVSARQQRDRLAGGVEQVCSPAERHRGSAQTPGPTVQRASALVSEGETESARQILMQAADVSPERTWERLWLLAHLEYVEGRYSVAIRSLREAATEASGPAAVMIAYELGELCREAGDSAGARAAYADALRLDPETPLKSIIRQRTSWSVRVPGGPSS